MKPFCPRCREFEPWVPVVAVIVEDRFAACMMNVEFRFDCRSLLLYAEVTLGRTAALTIAACLFVVLQESITWILL